jgi:hypothetical protein
LKLPGTKMNRPAANPTTCEARRGGRAVRRRAGITVGILLISLVFLSGFLALGVNAARLSQAQTQLRSTCQAAALAGAYELMDEGVLVGLPDQRDDVLSARQAAQIYGRFNPVDGRPIVLDPNTTNDPRGDLIVCTFDPYGPLGQPPVLPAQAAERVNTLLVTARLSRNSFDTVSLWFGKLAGLSSADVAASAQATLDYRVAGFRAEPGIRVPVVPMVADYDDWMRLATSPGVAGANDNYAVNYQTGEVVVGSDGIPEITLEFNPVPSEVEAAGTQNPEALATGRVAAMVLDDDGSNPSIWSTRTRKGLSQADLAALGGQLVVANGRGPIPVYAIVPPELPAALMEIIGLNRAWPLGLPAAAGSGPATSVIGFAAGRIVVVRLNESSSTPTWEVVVQPSTMVSSQAVTHPAMIPNPWIGKLELTQ